MTDYTWIAPTAASITAAIIAIITYLRSKNNGEKVDAVKVEMKAGMDTVTTKVDTVIEKATEIHSATNGTLHAITASRDVLEERVKGLEERLTAALESKILAATTAAQAATDVREAQASMPSILPVPPINP